MATRVERLDREVSRLTGVLKPKGGEEGELLSFAGGCAHRTIVHLAGIEPALQTRCVCNAASGMGQSARWSHLALKTVLPFGVLDHLLRYQAGLDVGRPHIIGCLAIGKRCQHVSFMGAEQKAAQVFGIYPAAQDA